MGRPNFSQLLYSSPNHGEGAIYVRSTLCTNFAKIRYRRELSNGPWLGYCTLPIVEKIGCHIRSPPRRTQGILRCDTNLVKHCCNTPNLRVCECGGWRWLPAGAGSLVLRSVSILGKVLCNGAQAAAHFPRPLSSIVPMTGLECVSRALCGVVVCVLSVSCSLSLACKASTNLLQRVCDGADRALSDRARGMILPLLVS